MKPIVIDISRADAPALLAECQRLGLTAQQGDPAANLRVTLRQYQKRQQLYTYERGRWALFAEQLGLQVTDDMEPRKIELLAYNHLYERLVTEGYIGRDLTGKPLRDPTDDSPFYITGRLSAEMVSVACPRTCKPQLHVDHGDSCAVWFAAGIAFEDVDRANWARAQWQEDHQPEGSNA